MTPLVLIPGFMCDGRLFDPQVRGLHKNHDITIAIPTERTLGEMARCVLDDNPGTFALGGLSMGGIIALEILRLAPDRITRLALMDTTPLADATQNYDIRTRQIADVHAGHLESVMRDELKPAYLVESRSKPAILDLCMAMAKSLGPDVFEAQSLALRDRADLQGALAHAPEHTLILYGAEDRLCTPERHHLMHRLAPHSRLVSIEKAGHLPTLERPFQTTAAVQTWLA
ncbi:alpha/beta fold hydrolase [Boseongicola aestuarii]|uniref:Carboxylesterase BioH n=1 Tax=Boseongicola aestuarii TaxID=1470561 RepID=A0A238IY51_9RHOB|nr:alpha/beta hydrolase [Boseongicola aestuarii]SMX23419.1 carboxylesterase BioH [Boseongicola aestuarii]